MRPSWHQVARKTVPKNVVKKHADWDRLFNDFCSILASNLGGQGGVNEPGFRYLLASGRPRGAQMAPRGLQAQIFGPFSPPEALFFNDFLIIFYRFHTIFSTISWLLSIDLIRFFDTLSIHHLRF